MNLSCLIVEDNALYRDIIIHLVNNEEHLDLVKACGSAEEAMQILRQTPIDVIFLDIELPDMNGFSFLSVIEKKPIVIVISGNDKYALQSYEWNVADFLMKPVTSDRFKTAIRKAMDMMTLRADSVEIEPQDFVFVRDQKNLQRVEFNDVLWIEAQGDYMKIQTHEKFHMVHCTLKFLHEKLPPKFIRVHRGFIVSIDKIDKIEENIVYINKKPIPVSDAYWAELKKRPEHHLKSKW